MNIARTCVVLVNFNTSKQTLACIDSLAKSSCSVSVVVVDNYSSRKDLEALEKSDRKFSLVKNSSNYGFGVGNNIGIKWALSCTEAEYIFVLNNDTLVETDTINLLQSAMDRNPAIGIASPRIMLADNHNIYWYGGGYLDFKRGGARSDRLLKAFDEDYEARDVSFVSGCAMFFRRSALLEVGGFDSRFFMYCEDQELCARYISAGWRIRYLPESLIYHEGHASIRGNSKTYLSPLDPENPSLLFYIEHVVAGSLLLLELSASSWSDRAIGLPYLCLRWGRHAYRLAQQGRWDALAAITKGMRRYQAARHNGDICRFSD